MPVGCADSRTSIVSTRPFASASAALSVFGYSETLLLPSVSATTTAGASVEKILARTFGTETDEKMPISNAALGSVGMTDHGALSLIDALSSQFGSACETPAYFTPI